MIINNIQIFICKVYATSGAGDMGGSNWSKIPLNELVGKILDFVFGAAGAIFVIMIIVGGLQYLTSAGNEETATKAKKIMTYAVAGIVITVGAWAISELLLSVIGGQTNWFKTP